MATINVQMLLSVFEMMIETRYFEIVKSKDVEFLDLSSRIMKETFDHRDVLKKRTDSLK